MNAQIELSDGSFALVDHEAYTLVAAINWHHTNNGYARGYAGKKLGGPGEYVRMHRFILGLSTSDPREVDHINGDRLDNRRANLRICSRTENGRNLTIYSNNSSGFKGVDWHKGAWRARIKVNKQSNLLGYFSTSEAAYAAYCEAAKKYFGEFARI